ncbi:MAG: HAD family hydrolase [Pseudomonadota bacterium]
MTSSEKQQHDREGGKHVMFDIDGTLVESLEFDETCYLEAVQSVTGVALDNDWRIYRHITDAGILHHHLEVNGLLANHPAIQAQVKALFIEKIAAHLTQTPARSVPGAAEFIRYLGKIPGVSLSIATGGWETSARIKLVSAGIDVQNIPLCSSDDHYARTRIMGLAARTAGVAVADRISYFGDAAWDKQACEELGFNFILVGTRTDHPQQITDFYDLEAACRYIGIDLA